MLDIRVLRSDPKAAHERLARRGDSSVLQLLAQALQLDDRRRSLIGEVETLKAERNAVSRQIGALKGRGEDASELIEAMQTTATRIRELDGELSSTEADLGDVLLAIPNFPDERVPPGGEGEGKVVHERGDRSADPSEAHWDIGPSHGLGGDGTASRFGAASAPLFDLERGAKVTGSGFPLLTGVGARLSRALINFMLDLHTREHDYLEVAPPFLVNRDSMTGTGHLPKFEEDMYRTDPDDLFLVPTAEVPLTNIHREEILAGEDLPLAYVAYTPCFRREAGAAGRDTRGLLRVHQFDKVELVRVCRAEDSVDELELLTAHAERVLDLLEVPYRRVLLPVGDLGFANAITYDLEIWSAGVGEWLEVSSCSSYADYQARRAGIRYRAAPGESPRFAHTLNGSGVALARLLIALLENGYEPGQGIQLPDVLHPYLGFERIDELP
jgi:seryl-tRNA synthetase